MNKEKEIKEMAKVLIHATDPRYMQMWHGGKTNAEIYATALYNAGYREVDEAERDTVKAENDTLKAQIDTVRRDTIAEFAEKVKAAICNGHRDFCENYQLQNERRWRGYDFVVGTKLMRDIDEIAKEMEGKV